MWERRDDGFSFGSASGQPLRDESTAGAVRPPAGRRRHEPNLHDR